MLLKPLVCQIIRNLFLEDVKLIVLVLTTWNPSFGWNVPLNRQLGTVLDWKAFLFVAHNKKYNYAYQLISFLYLRFLITI